MKKTLAILLMLTLLISALSACGNGENIGKYGALEKGKRYFHVAQKLCDDGTLYTFQYIEYLPLKDDYIKYSFFLSNLRYLDQYEAGYPETYSRDQQLIMEKILSEDYSPEDILALNPDDFTFEYLDKEPVFALIREGLTNAPEPAITDQYNWDRYDRGFLTELESANGYEFQVAYVSGSAGVDTFFIDVLYYDDDGTYTQLSDMVDNQTATDEQKQAFAEFGKIIEACQKNDSYIIDAAYQDTNIGGIDFGRLYTFLYNLHICNWDAVEEHHPNTTPERLN